jgi:hypothetical protein
MEYLDFWGKYWTGEDDWYTVLAYCQPWSPLDFPEDGGRLDATLIAKAAVRFAS